MGKYQLDGVALLITNPQPTSFIILPEKSLNTPYMWHMTHGMWHITHDIWHMICDMFGEVSIQNVKVFSQRIGESVN